MCWRRLFPKAVHPDERGFCHLQLKLRGIEAGEGTIEDPEMLTVIMEAREAIEATSDQDELRNFASVFQQQSSDCIQVIHV